MPESVVSYTYKDSKNHYLCSPDYKKNGNEKMAEYFAEKFVPLMDDLQNVLDKSDFSSELHFILKRV